MDRSLRKLLKVMPPLKGQRHTKVNWGRLEEYVGLTYPNSFKDFVSVYGSAHWFDKLLPFYSTARTVRLAQRFVKGVRQNVGRLAGNLYDAKFNRGDLPFYPEEGGLFPFMADIDGPIYYWLTEPKDPSRWPVYCWMSGPTTVLPGTTIAGMLLGFLERSPRMVRLWGDVRDFEPERIRIADVCIEG
jgi:hypothetical protein